MSFLVNADAGRSAMPPSSAAKRYRRLLVAAENGNARAMRELGVATAHGNGTTRDLPAAFRWFQAASLSGDVKAQHYLACCYDLGMGVPRNQASAEYWWRRAAVAGSPDAQARLDPEATGSAAANLPWSQPLADVTPREQSADEVLAALTRQSNSQMSPKKSVSSPTYRLGEFQTLVAVGSEADSTPLESCSASYAAWPKAVRMFCSSSTAVL